MSRIVQTRTVKLWLFVDWIFNLSSYGREQRRCLRILHSFTDRVIRERKAERRLLAEGAPRSADGEEDRLMASKLTGERPSLQLLDPVACGTGKRRLGFLDLLIDASQDGRALSDADIREEVDTFMFEVGLLSGQCQEPLLTDGRVTGPRHDGGGHQLVSLPHRQPPASAGPSLATHQPGPAS